MKRIIVLTAVLLAYSATVSGQTEDGVFRTLFFGRTHSAAGEAMGKTGLVSGSGATSHLFNPASLQYESGISVTHSRGSKYYLYDKGDYRYYGAAVRFGPRIAFAISMKSFDTQDYFEPFSEYKADLYTVSYAAELLWGLNAGISLNFFDQDITKYAYYYNPLMSSMPTPVDGNATRKGYYSNIGLMKSFTIINERYISSEIRTAISLSNLFNNRADATIGDLSVPNDLVLLIPPDPEDFEQRLPGIFRAGVSYRYSSRPADMNWHKSFDLKVGFEYYSFDPGDVSGSNFGAEISGFDLLYGRVGYFREHTKYEDFRYGGLRKYNKFTWGLGLKVPVHRMSESLPVHLNIDYGQYDEPHGGQESALSHSTFRILQFTMTYDLNR